MAKLRRPGACLLIAVIVLSAFVPGGLSFDWLLVEATWVLLPEVVIAPIGRPAPIDVEQPLSLRSLLPARAPPASA